MSQIQELHKCCLCMCRQTHRQRLQDTIPVWLVAGWEKIVQHSTMMFLHKHITSLLLHEFYNLTLIPIIGTCWGQLKNYAIPATKLCFIITKTNRNILI